MRQIVESLKRLFSCGKINEADIESLRRKGVIDDSERQYIFDLG